MLASPVFHVSRTGSTMKPEALCKARVSAEHSSVSVVSDADTKGNSKWKTFGERTIHDNPWVWLGEVDVELPDGERFWHHVIRLHCAAMTVLVNDDDQALLLWRHRFVQDRWGLGASRRLDR
jgi:hypothetical protein